MDRQCPWSVEGLVRLFAGVLTCVLMGSWAGLLIRMWTGEVPVRVGWLALPGLAGLATALGFTLQRWTWDRFRRQLIGFSLSFYVGLALLSLAHHWAGRSTAPPDYRQVLVAGLSFQGAALLLITRFLRSHGTTWRDSFGLDQSPVRALVLGAAAGCVVLPVAWTLQWLSMALLQRLHLTAEVQVAVQVLQDTTDWRRQLWLAAVAVGLAPPAEEALFRGLLFRSLRAAGYPRLAWWGTALLFALVHANAASFIALVLLALWLTWLFVRTGNLLAPIAAHAIFNALNFAAIQLYQHTWSGSG